VTEPSHQNVTQLLVDWHGGNQAALEQLVPIVYDELHRIAQRHMRRERPGHSMQASALVNEAYLRLIDQKAGWRNRSHFFGIAAQLMRRILVDRARAHHYAKRGGGQAHVTFDEAVVAEPGRTPDLMALDEALTSLAALDPQQARIVEMRFFGGLTIEETAEALGISHATVERDWAMARAWLRAELSR